MTEVKEGKMYVHRTEKATYPFNSKKEFVYLGQFVKIVSFNDADETANVVTRLGEYATVQMDELKPKPTVFYDDIPVAESHTPFEYDGQPMIGDAVDGRKVLRVKPIVISTIVGYNHDCKTLDDNIRLLQHKHRPMVFWCAEIG
jgi:hypothetical protein